MPDGFGAMHYGSGRAMLERVRSGSVDDSTFDLIFPAKIRRQSCAHWSPIQCAKRGAELAVAEPGARVLDVGAGPGKFCIVGSYSTEGIFVGIEQRRNLVEAAQEIAAHYKIPKVQFEHGNMADFDWRGFDSIFLYNPFSENLDESIRIDDGCELSSDLYFNYIRIVQRKLAELRAGTRVVTLNGFGGDLPPEYKLFHQEGAGLMPLELWIKN